MGFWVQPQYTLLTNADDRDLAGYATEGAFTAGGTAYFGHYFTPNFGILGGLGFARYLTTCSGAMPDSLVPFSTRIALRYFTLPLLLSGTGSGSSRLQFTYQLGIQAEALLEATWHTEGPIEPRTPMPTPDELYKGLNLAAVAAGGVQVRLYDNLFATAMLRATYAMTDAEDKKARPFPNDAFWAQRLYGTPGQGAATHPLGLGLQLGLQVVLNARNRF